jgi:regulatory protein
VQRTKARRPSNEVEVTLSNASSFFVPVTIWTRTGLREGDELDERQVEEITERSTRQRIETTALDLLARREHTRQQLIGKLALRYREDGVCRSVVDDLASRGLQSDERFADSWLRHRIVSHPESRARLQANLRARGVTEAIARTTLDSILQEEDLDDSVMIRRLLDKWSARGRLSIRALTGRLARLGFRRIDVEREIDRFVEEEGMENDG